MILIFVDDGRYTIIYYCICRRNIKHYEANVDVYMLLFLEMTIAFHINIIEYRRIFYKLELTCGVNNFWIRKINWFNCFPLFRRLCHDLRYRGVAIRHLVRLWFGFSCNKINDRMKKKSINKLYVKMLNEWEWKLAILYWCHSIRWKWVRGILILKKNSVGAEYE